MKSFNLIEIMLAIEIVAIGIVATLGVISATTQASKEAIANNFVPLAAEKSLQQIGMLALVDWTSTIASIPISCPSLSPSYTSSLASWTPVNGTLYVSSISPPMYGIIQKTGQNIDFAAQKFGKALLNLRLLMVLNGLA